MSAFLDRSLLVTLHLVFAFVDSLIVVNIMDGTVEQCVSDVKTKDTISTWKIEYEKKLKEEQQLLQEEYIKQDPRTTLLTELLFVTPVIRYMLDNCPYQSSYRRIIRSTDLYPNKHNKILFYGKQVDFPTKGIVAFKPIYCKWFL